MNLEQMRAHALEMAFVYEGLKQDLANYVEDIDAHNLCSAVIEHGAKHEKTLYSYSNPAALPQKIKKEYVDLVIGDVAKKFIVRGGMQDLHTEVRLINQLYNDGFLTDNRVVTFFSSRSVCASCRAAIVTTYKTFGRSCAFNAMEFKVEAYGSITDKVFPILQDAAAAQAAVPLY